MERDVNQEQLEEGLTSTSDSDEDWDDGVEAELHLPGWSWPVSVWLCTRLNSSNYNQSTASLASNQKQLQRDEAGATEDTRTELHSTICLQSFVEPDELRNTSAAEYRYRDKDPQAINWFSVLHKREDIRVRALRKAAVFFSWTGPSSALLRLGTCRSRGGMHMRTTRTCQTMWLQAGQPSSRSLLQWIA